MRVAFLSHNARHGDAIGGQLLAKVLYFLERGADVRVLLETDDSLHPDVAPHAAMVARIEMKGPVWDYLAECDLVFAEYPHWYELLHYLPLLAGKRPRIVVEYHGVTPVELGNEPQRDVLRRGQRQRGIVWCADAVLVHSRFIAEELAQATGYPRGRMAQLPCVCTSLHREQGSSWLALRARKDVKTLLLFVGRLAANKRVPILLQALARLSSDVHVLLLGDASDVYSETAQQCRDLANDLGVGSRVHFTGKVDDDVLADAYASADVFVMPSLHEGFCLPVAEAMAAGLPVVTARAAALPETVGPAGVTFIPDDPADLARQIRRVLDADQEAQAKQRYRVAVVAFRFGAAVVGGAEASLRTLALTLRGAGHHVTIFTTCTQHESAWSNDLPAGIVQEEGLEIRRFPIDVHDRAAHAASVRTILDGRRLIDTAAEEGYLRHSIHSTALLDALRQEIGALDAVIVGPYLFGLTWDVAQAFPAKTLLVPCFHDEPLAYLRAWTNYASVGGMLYHSPEEQEFAQTTLGLNHPRATQLGTWLETTAVAALPARERYLVYCGRYSPHKNVPLLLEYLDRYQRDKPGRFVCYFLGTGDVLLPRQPWLRDLGKVDEARKRQLLAGADALVQLSVHESLSLVALEAWTQGTPVIAHADCAVLVGQCARSGGGQTVGDYAAFALALDDLWVHPDLWKMRGQAGQDYVRRHYGSRNDYLARITDAVAGLALPLREHMKRRGLAWSARCQPDAWREGFGRFIECVLDAEALTIERHLQVHLHRAEQSIPVGARQHLLALRLVNRGNQPALPDGPAKTMLHWQVGEMEGTSALPGVLLPGETRPASLTIELPTHGEPFNVQLWATCAGCEIRESRTSLTLHVASTGVASSPLLEDVARALAEAQRWQRLPDNYVDVTEGWFARCKRWCKRKLLGNFKHAYVDVLSRQQSHVNENLVLLCHSLAEHNAALEQALERVQEKLAALEANAANDAGKETGLFTSDRLKSNSI